MHFHYYFSENWCHSFEFKDCLLFINTSQGVPSREKSLVKQAMMAGAGMECNWKRKEYLEN